MTRDEFIRKSKDIHGEKYDYSLVKYVNSSTFVEIIYNGVIYNQKPTNHLQGFCPENLVLKMNTNIFIENSIKKHGYKYDYSETVYESRYKKVRIKYKNHVYEQTPDDHLRGCQPEEKIKKKTTDQFIQESKLIHGDNKYDYSLVEYKDKFTKVKIIYEGNIYSILPRYHLKYGVILNKSKGETIIKSELISKNIEFLQQYSFSKCKSKKKLRFDFYLPKYNACIEYDGIQHHKPIDYFGGKDSYLKQLDNDNIKNRFCEENGIVLIRIPYFKMNEVGRIISSTFQP